MLFVAVIAIAVLAIALILMIVLKPSLTEGRTGMIIAFVGLFALPVFATTIAASSHLEKSKSVDFCLSCHNMEPYVQSLRIEDPNYLPASHFQNKT